MPLVAHAERDRAFPRAAIARLGARGLLRERWTEPASGLGAELAEELGRAGAGGVGIGVTVHSEAALSVLLRYGRSPLVRSIAERALDGREIVAVASSEASGSDLSSVETTVAPDGDGLRVRGLKRYVSLGAVADHLLVLARDGARGGGDRLTLIAVPRDGVRVEERLPTAGVRSLETVRLAIDARVPASAVVGRSGAGLLALTWGLSHERLATAAVAIGSAELAIRLATAELQGRRVGDRRLFAYQRPRLLLAEHAAEVAVLRRALHAFARAPRRAGWTREVAGLKVVAARSVERTMSDCMHLFGASGYIEDATPLTRLWRDVRAARIGGGTDEMMWELVAGGLTPDGWAADAAASR